FSALIFTTDHHALVISSELRAQCPHEKGDDQDGHDKCPVRVELQSNQHQLRSNRPARLTDCQIVLGGKGDGPLSLSACRVMGAGLPCLRHPNPRCSTLRHASQTTKKHKTH